MSKHDAVVTINDNENCTLVTVNTNTISTVLSVAPVAKARRKRSLTIFLVIIAVVLIVGTVANLVVVLIKNGSTTKQKATTKMMSTTKPRVTTSTPQTIKFAAQKTYSTGYHSLPTALVVIDVNNDNKMDIIVANQEGDNVGVLYNYYNKMFYAQEAYGLDGSRPQSVSVVDVNGDDRLDIVVGCSGISTISVLLNDGPWDFTNRLTYHLGYNSHLSGLTVVDINNDNKLAVIVTNKGTNNINILFNYDTETFRSKDTIQFEYGTGPTSPLVVDINEDNKPDIIFANYIGNSVGILFNFGNGTFHSLTTYPTGFGSKPKFISVVDVNEDAKPDIIVANSLANNIGIFLNSGNGTFLPQQTYSTGNNSNPYCVSVIDLNNDNKPEIIVANANHNTIGIFINYGNSTFILEYLYSTGLDSNPQFVSVVDVNGDGKLDIIVANSHVRSKNGNVGVMLGI